MLRRSHDADRGDTENELFDDSVEGYYKFTCTYAETPATMGTAGNKNWSITGSNQKADVYVPKGKTPEEVADLAVTVWTHGGGFTDGRKDEAATTIAPGMATDAVFVSINYTLRKASCMTLVIFPLFIDVPCNYEYIDLDPTDGSSFDEETQFLADIADAVIWVRDTLTVFAGSPDRMTLSGGSAGGVTTALLATSPRYLAEAAQRAGSEIPSEAADVLAGAIAVSAPLHLNVEGDGIADDVEGPLAPGDAIVDASVAIASLSGVIRTRFDLDSSGDYDGDPATTESTWEAMSPIWHYQRNGTAPPLMVVSGGGNCKYSFAFVACNEDFSDPPLIPESGASLVTLVNDAGGNATLLQPVLRRQASVKYWKGWSIRSKARWCAAYTSHGGYAVIAPGGEGVFLPGHKYQEENQTSVFGYQACDKLGVAGAKAEIAPLAATIGDFIADVGAGGGVNSESGLIEWAPNDAGQIYDWKTTASVPDSQ